MFPLVCRNFLLSILALAAAGCCGTKPSPHGPSTTSLFEDNPDSAAVLREPLPQERHLRNLRQITFGGENAEAYFSPDGTRLIFQSKRPPYDCDQIFTMKIDGSDLKRVSTGRGRTTCSYFYYPNGDRILFSSTHLAGDDCPPEPSHDHGYVWPIYLSYDIFAADVDGSHLTRLTESPGYDAEATFNMDGSRVVFTSTRDGDLDIYTMNPDGSDVKRLTNVPGYDGGPFFSPDGTKICYRAFHPEGKELEDYRGLLRQGLVRPTSMELYVMNADGSDQHCITSLGKAAFAPYFTPDSKRILFASNHGGDPREFDIYMINVDGTGLERITYTPEFDGFPMFSPDGKYLAFSSNRFNEKHGETNVFIAEWVE